MTDLGPHLERLGLEQYLDVLLSEGFDTWETLLDIQEGDFEKLNFKLGHRRKLQRAIADFRGVPYERVVGSPAGEAPSWGGRGDDGSAATATGGDRGGGPPQEAKRKYRRHPKPDENAPERPPSAYVIFSNKIREDIKGENLNFAQIARLVGDKWQKLEPGLKEPYEAQANAMKERYNIQLSAYKKTDAYREYLQYLADFRARHAPSDKKPRLDRESSGGSPSARSFENTDTAMTASTVRARVGSMGSMSSTPHMHPLQSPVSNTQMTGMAIGHGSGSGAGRYPVSTSRGGSPPISQWPPRPPMSTQSSVSDDSIAPRSETDSLPRVSILSMNTPPASALPPLLQSESDPTGRGKYSHLPPQQAGATSARVWSGSSLVHRPSGPSLPSPVITDSPWRMRTGELRTYPDPPRNLPPLPQQPPVSMHGGISLPPLGSGERLPDLSQSHGPRTLPPPLFPLSGPAGTVVAPGPPAAPYRIGADLNRPHQQYHPASSSTGRNTGQSVHDRSEDDAAAKALTGLASSGGSSGGPSKRPRSSPQYGDPRD